MQSAYLIVKCFDALYREFAAKLEIDRAIYALPMVGTEPAYASIQYHGIDRDPLVAYTYDLALAAEIRMAELERMGRCSDAYLFQPDDVVEVIRWAEEERPGFFEPVWARVAGSTDAPPGSYRKAGYEPSYFPNGYFSALCDCLCFPRWHGTDPEGTLFREHFARLNPYGLFDTSSWASEFLRFYRSFEWTETGNYEIIEVWLPTR